MDTSPDFFRNAVREFKEADQLCKQIDNVPEESANFHPSSKNLTPLRNAIEDVRKAEVEFVEINNELAELRQRYQEVLASEKSVRETMRIAICVGVVILVGIGYVIHSRLLQKTSLSFSVLLDDKPLPADRQPSIKLDGKPFTSGDKISLGSHRLSVSLKDTAPIQRDFFAFYGAKTLGALTLTSHKGAVNLTSDPADADFELSGNGYHRQGKLPANFNDVPLGEYKWKAQRKGWVQEKNITVEYGKITASNIEFPYGSISMASDPADADFELSGNRYNRQGKLPARFDEVPVGEYQWKAQRNGWLHEKKITVERGKVTASNIEFPYGSIAVTSEPTGLSIFTNGVEIGKTPKTLAELQPGSYTVTIVDGENDLIETIPIKPKEVARHNFVFRYGTLQVASIPSGATVIRKGKEVGKTPLTLSRVPVETAPAELFLKGYATTNFATVVQEGVTAKYEIKLVNELFLAAIQEARTTLADNRFPQAQAAVTRALELEPNDPTAVAVRDEIAFNLRRHAVETALSKGNPSEATTALAEMEKLYPNAKEISAFKESVANQKIEHLKKVLANAEDALNKGLIDEGIQKFAEAEKLAEDNYDKILVSKLRVKVAPALRDKNWQEAKRLFKGSALSESYVWKYHKDLQTMRDGTIKAMGEFMSAWKMKSEEKPDDRTIILTLEPKGIGSIGFPYAGVLMLWRNGETGMTDMYSQFWMYAPADNQTAVRGLHTMTWSLSKCLGRKVGQPWNSQDLPRDP